MRANEILTERFFNAFTPKDKMKYSQQAWDMIQRSYEPIGGFHGPGFSNMEDMIASNRMFKFGIYNGKPVMVAIYKDDDQGGRKKVAVGTDGSDAGVKLARNSIEAELHTGRAYGEFSGGPWGVAKKKFPPEVLTTFLVPASEVSELIQKEITPGAGADMRTQGENDPYNEYYYQREIQGHWHTKVAYGDKLNKARFT